MRLAGILLLVAGPAAAHHEAAVVTVLPSVMPLILAGAVGVAAFWARWRQRK